MEHLDKEKYIESLISSIDLKTLLSIYFLQNQDATQIDIAEKLNIGKMTISRIMNREHTTIRSEWVNPIRDLLEELDLERLFRDLSHIQSVRSLITALSKLEQVSDIAYQHFSDTTGQTVTIDNLIFEGIAPGCMQGFTLNTQQPSVQWEFRSLDVAIPDSYVRIRPTLEPHISRIIREKAQNIVCFTTDASVYKVAKGLYRNCTKQLSLMKHRNSHPLFPKDHQHLIMLFDLEKRIVANEDILQMQDSED